MTAPLRRCSRCRRYLTVAGEPCRFCRARVRLVRRGRLAAYRDLREGER